MKLRPDWWPAEYAGGALYVITDRRATCGRSLIGVVEAALVGGARLVQLREKDLGGRDLVELARNIRAMTRYFGARLLVNGRADAAILSGADGVHVGAGSIPVEDARRLLGPDAIIGVSTHSTAEATSAEKNGADLVTAGPVYETPSKARYGPPVGLSALGEIAAAVRIPVFALGGVKAGNTAEVMRAGASGVAVISAVMAAEDVRDAAGKLIRSLGPPA